METSIGSALKKTLSWFALLMGIVAAVVVLGNYIVSAQQSYRGPSLVYFYIFLVLALWSRTWSTALLIFSLPILPNLAIQAEYIFHPRVTYFIAYPGVDSVIGLFVGQVIRSLWKKQRFDTAVQLPPWTVGLGILVITMATALSICRNLWQSASVFYLPGLLNNLLRFKHMGSGNDYLPLADLIVYSVAGLLIACMLSTLKLVKSKDDFVFRPVILSVMVAAVWGVFQAVSRFGLPDFVLQYRTNTIGYGALGFQPDIHAFAGHMLIGAVGLLGYFTSQKSVQSKFWIYVGGLACFMSWLALLLSKSRASLLFAVMFVVVYVIIAARQKNTKTTKNIALTILVFIGIVIGYLWSANNLWVTDAIKEVAALQQINFQTLNRLSVYRLELFTSALKMFWSFPLMGLGQGNFLHQSIVPGYISILGGENAHNYFLQTIAELGLAGLISFLLIFLVPIFNTRCSTKFTPILFAIFAVFIGNIYSHPLIIRENLLLLAVFVSLLYALVDTRDRKTDSNKFNQKVALSLICCGVFVFGFFAWSEIRTSFQRAPFLFGAECFKANDKLVDGWMTGRLIVPVPRGATSFEAEIDKNQPDAPFNPLDADVMVLDNAGQIILSQRYSNLHFDEFKLSIDFSSISFAKAHEPNSVRIDLSRCFTPSNFGLKDDVHKKGLHIKAIGFE